MEPTKELIDDLYVERVLRARETPGEQKLFASADLFEWACSIARAGIRDQYPDADADEVERILAQRLALQEQLREAR